MKSVDQYFSIVDDRIVELQKKLEIAQHKKQHTQNSRSYKRHQLECEMIEKKIAYLKRLTKLPLLLAIDALPAEELEKLHLGSEIPKNSSKEQLIQFFKLEQLEKWVKSPKVVTLAYIKDAFMNDFEAILSLLEMNQRNFDLKEQRQKLYGIGLDGSNSYLKISFDEKALNRDEEKVESAIAEVQENFNIKSLREVYNYMHNKDQRLPYEFILKYSDKVVANNPEMAKLVKRLKRKKHFKWIDKLPFKRSKKEHTFMAAILNYYNNNNAINSLGISSMNIFDMSDKELRDFAKYAKNQSSKKREEISARRVQIEEARKEVLAQIKACDLQQAQEKERFVNLIHTKTSFHPKMFEEQLWNEPSLKDSIMLESCYLEEKMIIEKLKEALKLAISPIEVKPIEQSKAIVPVKKLVA